MDRSRLDVCDLAAPASTGDGGSRGRNDSGIAQEYSCGCEKGVVAYLQEPVPKDSNFFGRSLSPYSLTSPISRPVISQTDPKFAEILRPGPLHPASAESALSHANCGSSHGQQFLQMVLFQLLFQRKPGRDRGPAFCTSKLLEPTAASHPHDDSHGR